MSKSKSIGYNGETLIAKYLELKRTGAQGIQIYDLEDTNHKYFGLLKIEVKSGKQVPKLVENAFSQVLPHIEGIQVPAVIMVPKGTGEAKLEENARVILRLKDFKFLIDNKIADMGNPISIIVTFDNGKTVELKKEEE